MCSTVVATPPQPFAVTSRWPLQNPPPQLHRVRGLENRPTQFAWAPRLEQATMQRKSEGMGFSAAHSKVSMMDKIGYRRF